MNLIGSGYPLKRTRSAQVRHSGYETHTPRYVEPYEFASVIGPGTFCHSARLDQEKLCYIGALFVTILLGLRANECGALPQDGAERVLPGGLPQADLLLARRAAGRPGHLDRELQRGAGASGPMVLRQDATPGPTAVTRAVP